MADDLSRLVDHRLTVLEQVIPPLSKDLTDIKVTLARMEGKSSFAKLYLAPIVTAVLSALIVTALIWTRTGGL